MYYIGIDVSKKDLSVFDGKKDLTSRILLNGCSYHLFNLFKSRL